MSEPFHSDVELPQAFKRHVFACHTQRPPQHPRGSCGARGAQPLWDRLTKKLETAQMPDLGFAASGCLGFCSAGPLMVVYPEGVWYQPKTTDDIDEIFARHLVGGELVERLAIILSK